MKKKIIAATITNMMFMALEKIRDFERKKLPFLNSLECREILLVLGIAEESGTPITVKQLMYQLDSLNLDGIGKRSTIRRRLEALIDVGLIETRKESHDARFIYLHLSRDAIALFSEYHKCIFEVNTPLLLDK